MNSRGGGHRDPRYAFDMFAREFHMSVQICKKNYVITQLGIGEGK